MRKLVSIISPCYNGEKYLPPFLESVLEQTYRPIELLFVDDGSIDNTKGVLMSYADRFKNEGIALKYYFQENAGQAAAINRALPHFIGDYVMWMDSDDVLLPENVEKKVQYLELNPGIDFVLTQGMIVQSDDIDTPLGVLKRIHTAADDEASLFRDLVFEHNVVYVPATCMVRRFALRKAIPTLQIYEGRQGQNWQLMLPLAYTSKVGYIDEILFKYVIHADSHSHITRSYEETIQRADEFQKLLYSTIDSIVQMPDEEKVYWKKQVDIKYARRKMQEAYCRRMYHKGKVFCTTLKENDAFGVTDIYPVFRTKLFLSRIKQCIKKMIKNKRR